MRTLYLYGRMVGLSIRSRMQYKSDFLVGMVSVVLLNWINLTMIWVMISRFQSLQGWVFWEIVMLYGLWLLSHSVYSLLFWHVTQMEEDIIHGRFDQYMLRPMSPLAQFLGREANYMGVADVIFATTIFVLAYRNLGLDWSPLYWAFFGVAVASGTIIETCLFLLVGTVSFWTGRSRFLGNFVQTFNMMGQQWPLDVFGKWYKLFVTGFLPIAFMNYYPLTLLLGKATGGTPLLLSLLSPAVAATVLGITAFVWTRGVRSYSSSGN